MPSSARDSFTNGYFSKSFSYILCLFKEPSPLSSFNFLLQKSIFQKQSPSSISLDSTFFLFIYFDCQFLIFSRKPMNWTLSYKGRPTSSVSGHDLPVMWIRGSVQNVEQAITSSFHTRTYPRKSKTSPTLTPESTVAEGISGADPQAPNWGAKRF